MLEESTNTNGEKVYLFNGNTFTSKEEFWLQATRFAAVIIGGPFLIFLSINSQSLPIYSRVLLFILGILAIWSNGLSYLREMK